MKLQALGLSAALILSAVTMSSPATATSEVPATVTVESVVAESATLTYDSPVVTTSPAPEQVAVVAPEPVAVAPALEPVAEPVPASEPVEVVLPQSVAPVAPETNTEPTIVEPVSEPEPQACHSPNLQTTDMAFMFDCYRGEAQTYMPHYVYLGSAGYAFDGADITHASVLFPGIVHSYQFFDRAVQGNDTTAETTECGDTNRELGEAWAGWGTHCSISE